MCISKNVLSVSCVANIWTKVNWSQNEILFALMQVAKIQDLKMKTAVLSILLLLTIYQGIHTHILFEW